MTLFEMKKTQNQLRDRPALRFAGIASLETHMFRTWKTYDLDKQHLKKIQKVEKQNREFSFIYFDNERVENYMSQFWGNHAIYEIFLNAKFWVNKIDIWRLCVVHQMGGGYLDIDSHIPGKLREIVVENSERFSFEKNSLDRYLLDMSFPTSQYLEKFREVIAKCGVNSNHPVLNWCFFAKKGHPVIGLAIEEIVRNADFFYGRNFENTKLVILHFTSPPVLTVAVWRYILEGGKISIEDFDFGGRAQFKDVPKKGKYESAKHYSSVKKGAILSSK